MVVLAATNACAYTRRFTRFSGELFGALIAVRQACGGGWAAAAGRGRAVGWGGGAAEAGAGRVRR